MRSMIMRIMKVKLIIRRSSSLKSTRKEMMTMHLLMMVIIIPGIRMIMIVPTKMVMVTIGTAPRTICLTEMMRKVT